jgi:hypothetical protein
MIAAVQGIWCGGSHTTGGRRPSPAPAWPAAAISPTGGGPPWGGSPGVVPGLSQRGAARPSSPRLFASSVCGPCYRKPPHRFAHCHICEAKNQGPLHGATTQGDPAFAPSPGECSPWFAAPVLHGAAAVRRAAAPPAGVALHSGARPA